MRIITRFCSVCAVAIMALVVTSGNASADGIIDGNSPRIVTCASLLGELEACSAQKVADLSHSCEAERTAARLSCRSELVAIAFLRGIGIGAGVLVPVDPVRPQVECTNCTCSCVDNDGDYSTISGQNCSAGSDTSSASNDAECTNNDGSGAMAVLQDCSNDVTCSNN